MGTLIPATRYSPPTTLLPAELAQLLSEQCLQAGPERPLAEHSAQVEMKQLAAKPCVQAEAK